MIENRIVIFAPMLKDVPQVIRELRRRFTELDVEEICVLSESHTIVVTSWMHFSSDEWDATEQVRVALTNKFNVLTEERNRSRA